HRSGRAKPQWRAAPWRLRAGALASKSDRGAACRACERASVSFGRTSRRGRGWQSQNAPQTSHRRPRLRHKSRSLAGSRRQRLDRAESRGFSRRGPRSSRQGNCVERRAESTHCAAKPGARNQAAIMMHTRQFPALIGLALAVLIGGCTVGPKYQRATAPVPAKWDVAEPWRESAPKDGLAKGQWWSAFNDDDLGALEKQSLDANQTIKVAAARLEQARASAAVQIATQFPVLSTTPSTGRQRLSGNRPANSNLPVNSAVSQSNNILPFTVGYEVDLFGRRRRSIEAAQASYQASAADLENVRLVITAELAGDYFTLRQLDTELGILNRTVQTLKKGLQLVDSRHKGGVASGLD